MKRVYKLPRPYTPLGTILAQARIDRRLTQREVSIRLGYSSPQFVSNFERGISAPPLKKARKLIKMLRIDPQFYADHAIACERAILGQALGGRG